MSKLSIDQKTIFGLFSDKRADFLIPDYQRPYAWTEDECATLWQDIITFAIPENNAENFDDNEEYFLGPIVTFRNEDTKLEIIDGQQRLTTLMLLLRAFYSKFEYMQDERSKSTLKLIGQCIWKTDEFGEPDRNRLKIDSEVASDGDKTEFLEILKSGDVESFHESRYAASFRYFRDQIQDFVATFPSYVAHLATRILKNVILLPIEAESQRTALRIFSTLNDRGLPLSDADIFKSQFYKYFSDKSEKDKFVDRWKTLETLTDEIFETSRNHPMDELFTRYMYYERAKRGIKSSTTEGLRDFFEKDSYALLKREQTLKNIENLADFWRRVDNREDFSDRILRQLAVLAYAPNSMWTYIVSVYVTHDYVSGRDIDEENFFQFLRKITAFIWANSVVNPGVNALRTPVYHEMVSIVNDQQVTFDNYKFDRSELTTKFDAYAFTNNRPVTKSLLVGWAYGFPDQELFPSGTKLETEHIFSRRRANEEVLSYSDSLESLGNKAVMEKSVNIRASDYRFEDKKKYYKGFVLVDGRRKVGTNNSELRSLAERQSFTETDIRERKIRILNDFYEYLAAERLFKDTGA